ncbi:MAG: hypothetical protein NTX47_07525 [Candidatus Omnitrophica bacterium]|nr:hypothetical protein [Candidatus Omnitrophota bacterium]
MNVNGRPKAALDFERSIEILTVWLKSCHKDDISGTIRFFPDRVMVLSLKGIPQPIIVPDGPIKEAAKLFWEMVISARKHPRGVSVVPISIKVGEDIGNVLKEEASGSRKRAGQGFFSDRAIEERLPLESNFISGCEELARLIYERSKGREIIINAKGVEYPATAEIQKDFESVNFMTGSKTVNIHAFLITMNLMLGNNWQIRLPANMKFEEIKSALLVARTGIIQLVQDMGGKDMSARGAAFDRLNYMIETLVFQGASDDLKIMQRLIGAEIERIKQEEGIEDRKVLLASFNAVNGKIVSRISRLEIFKHMAEAERARRDI